jgi:hypothetical protein
MSREVVDSALLGLGELVPKLGTRRSEQATKSNSPEGFACASPFAATHERSAPGGWCERGWSRSASSVAAGRRMVTQNVGYPIFTA